MHKLLALAVAAGAVLLLALGLTTPASSTPAGPPPGDTVVEVTGDRANGFEIHFYDGTALFPPTDSEARAECGEYDTRVARVRCRTEVRTWYRDLGDLKQALDWAHTSG
ncbi:hypothetical protein [Nocardioides dongkuii]|uniref:hypothetical protein n=1 Tax=Nocardioides dongkuii TaxID=2760089 RepID=UPI001D0CBFD9|nr:hypothetical protein [Nocardioides dongkuii]